VLKRSRNEAVRRHEALRMRTEATDDGPRQCVTAAEVPLEYVAVKRRRVWSRERDPAEVAARVALQPFDYPTGILLRAHVIQRSDRDTIVVLVVPHIVSDSTSIQILIREVLTLYAPLLRDRPSPLTKGHTLQRFCHLATKVFSRRRGCGDRYVATHLLAGARPLELPDGGCDRGGPFAADAAEVTLPIEGSLVAGVTSGFDSSA
jgi:hypothetical protein